MVEAFSLFLFAFLAALSSLRHTKYKKLLWGSSRLFTNVSHLFLSPRLFLPTISQEVWACWCELLSYLEQENGFLDELEQKLDETENLQGGAEELQEALDVSITERSRGRSP